MAKVRWRGTRNMLRISDRVDGASVAPAIPRTARVRIRVPVLRDIAATTEAAPNAAAPMSRSRRRPIRSPRFPIVTRKPATKNP
jgi:hypothetical protein